ncbi:hypothetical protein [Natronococcus wangiae]|uniref:hypothetical protein n=1 Tax=Natronococcus wangiae TaxID=3068275 RepID=UPI00273E8A4A|nr:hypothetical protein [Natronococcus sp. AD5]
MRRRELLAYAAGGFGGIVAFESGTAGAVPIDRFADESRCDEAGVTDRALERRDQRCVGDQRDEATIRFTDDGVIVDGAIRTPTPCHALELEPVWRDANRDVLAVLIGSRRHEGTICAQCLGLVEYEARVDLEDHPDRVEVVHERRSEAIDVAAADR